MITEHQIRLSQAQSSYEDIQPDPVMARWKFGLFWYGGLAFCIAALFGAGYCLMMAWRALG